MQTRPDRRDSLKLIASLGASGAVAALPRAGQAQAKPITVGVIYVGPRDDYGYNQAQAQAAAEIKKLPGVKIVEEENVPETNAAQKAMMGMIAQDGATLLFPTSFGYFDPHILAVAPKSNGVRFSHCGGLWTEGKHPMNVGSYFGYIDECQYLNGIVAGHMTKSDKIAFVAAKPIPQVLRNINAYALGARSVKPGISCSVIFTGDWSMPVKEAEATNSLADQGCDVFTMHVDGPKVVVETAARRGKFVCGYHASQAKLAPNAYLTGAEWNWLTVYKTVVEAARTGKPHPNFLRGGLKDGYVKASPYGPSVSEGARKNADEVKAKMMAGGFDIFQGPIKDNKGNPVIAGGKTLVQTDLELEKMNYLVDGVVGSI
ncbi:MAG: BMP family ABC transporter substrate-binding protein [Burkholderiaceae bacterium]